MRQRGLLITVVAAAIALGAGLGARHWWQDPAPESGSAFALPDLDQRMRSLDEWAGKIVILNFWATWCPPCVKEIPAFIELQEAWGEQGVQFVGIAIDEADKVADFIDAMDINYPILVGGTDAIEIGKAYGNQLGTLPYTVFLDPSGEITHIQRGELRHEEAETLIQSRISAN